MQISPKFNDDNFELNSDKKAVALEVGFDDDNIEQHFINLVLQFEDISGYNELAFYFNVTNKDNTKITVEPKAIYDRNIAKKYLPKELSGKDVFREKTYKMLKELIKMEKPTIFFMETYEVYRDSKQISYYDNLVKLILENGYAIVDEGVGKIEKKYYWKFVNKNTPGFLPEGYKDDNNFGGLKKDAEYWRKMNELSEMTIIETKNKKIID